MILISFTEKLLK